MTSRHLPLRSRSPATSLLLGAMFLLAPMAAFAQNNSFATVIQNNAMWQANLTKQMINLGGTPTSGGGASPASCMPPYDLQRGVNGEVPPQLQGDPRYQEYLRCKQGQASPASQRTTSVAPSFPAGQHLPITATDFVPVRPGHPFVDQTLVSMTITPEQRTQLRSGASELFKRVATQYRGNNMAVSVAVAYATAMSTLDGSQMNPQQTREFVFGVNDMLARDPKFARMSALDKQNGSDGLIFQTLIISVLRDMGGRDPQARQQAMELSRAVLKQLNGA